MPQNSCLTDLKIPRTEFLPFFFFFVDNGILSITEDYCKFLKRGFTTEKCVQKTETE